MRVLALPLKLQPNHDSPSAQVAPYTSAAQPYVQPVVPYIEKAKPYVPPAVLAVLLLCTPPMLCILGFVAFITAPIWLTVGFLTAFIWIPALIVSVRLFHSPTLQPPLLHSSCVFYCYVRCKRWRIQRNSRAWSPGEGPGECFGLERGKGGWSVDTASP
jgi:hypothetical protein